MAATLTKQERLHGKEAIDSLLSKGKFCPAGEMKYCFRTGTGEPVNRIMVSVPKKFFKRAVKRNLIKRRIREAYRCQKGLLERNGNDILFIYNSREILCSEAIRSKVGEILKAVNEVTKAE